MIKKHNIYIVKVIFTNWGGNYARQRWKGSEKEKPEKKC